MGDNLNGSNHEYLCPLHEQWNEFQRKTEENSKKILGIEVSMANLLVLARNLEHLKDLVDSSKNQESLLREMKNSLLAPAIGKDHIPTDVAKEILSEQGKTFRSVYRILGGVIGILAMALGILLTGQKLGWFGAFH